jgi:ATP-dependent Lon protease
MAAIEPQLYTLPLVPMRDMVIFPETMAPFYVGRPTSVAALEKSLQRKDRLIFLSAQKDPSMDNPKPEDIYPTGIIATILQHAPTEASSMKVIVEGLRRAHVERYLSAAGYHEVEVKPLFSESTGGRDVDKYMEFLLGLLKRYAKLSQNNILEALIATIPLDHPGTFSDKVAASLKISTPDKQELLEILNPLQRVQRLNDLIDTEIEKLNIEKRINQKVRKQMEKAQKEYYLSEKIKAIHDELGQAEDRTAEIQELKKKIEDSGMPEEVRAKVLHELKRLETMGSMSAEAVVSRSYVDWLVALPWKNASKEIKDLKRAEQILNEDHHGLEKIKDRILEFLAVRQLAKEHSGTTLCFVGPPGVGKTSLAKSIARAMGRKFVRLSLGGVRDEAEVRGHRRTYIGAFPGQIIQMMKKAGTINPVFLLDEIDKMSMDFRGDPSAALMEVLDAEQNRVFNDHYVDADYDLSHVFFITTANVLHPVPPALKDRMEVLHLSGYTDMEKIQIAQRHLIPKQLKKHGLAKAKVTFTDAAILHLIDHFTREAGVRSLEREIASICRKLAKEKVTHRDLTSFPIGAEQVAQYLGKPRFLKNRAVKDEPQVGIALGLAWTEFGGEILTTEATKMPGKANLILTGQLGEVMQESARAALSYVRSRSAEWELDPELFQKCDIHIHVPEGAIPKDGPSAGITMAVALASLVREIPVRSDLAMTGEVTLRGKVLPVGGIKDKILGAYRAGILTILLPKENEKDLEDIPKDVAEKMRFILVSDMREVLGLALLQDPVSGRTEGKVPAQPRPEEKSLPL